MRTSLTIGLFLLLLAGPSRGMCGGPGEMRQEEQAKEAKQVGDVLFYEPGKKIDIGIRPQVGKSYNLSSKDTTYSIDPEVRVGSHVEIEETKKDQNGQKLISIRVKSPK